MNSSLEHYQLLSVAYIVLLEECEVTNNSNPNQECGGSQQDAAQIIRGHILSEDNRSTFHNKHSMKIAELIINSEMVYWNAQ